MAIYILESTGKRVVYIFVSFAKYLALESIDKQDAYIENI